MKRKILIVEDDEAIIDFIQAILESEDYEVQTAINGIAAINAIQEEYFSLILLDLGLPDIEGIELLKLFRAQLDSPIIIISARNDELGKVKSLDLGADDYVTKPFGTKELLARIRTTLRHYHIDKNILGVIKNGSLVLDIEKKSFFVCDQEIHLTKNEFRILEVLFENIGKVVTYDRLMKILWGPYTKDQRILRVNVSNIRRKIEPNPLEPIYILTEVGIGYRLKDNRQEN